MPAGTQHPKSAEKRSRVPGQSRLKRILGALERSTVVPIAKAYRPILRSIRMIAVTGSCGKTQTKELVADLLSQEHRTHRSFDSNNVFFSVARTVLELRPSHEFCVLELGAAGPGTLGPSIDLVRPDVAIVTAVGEDHFKAFRGADAVAREKSKLVQSLGPEGVAVLNADDGRVAAMADDCRGRVVTYGRESDAMVRGVVVSNGWPDRLTLRISYDGATVLVATRLLGDHLTSCVLAAIAAGIACGVPLQKVPAAFEKAAPVFGRMCEASLPDNITVVYDHYKAPYWSMSAVLEFMAAARARRKILVIGTLSDYVGNARRRYRELAKAALAAADQVVFASTYAPGRLRNLKAAHAGRLHVFRGTYEAARFIEDIARPGDLILLKGSVKPDHFERIGMQLDNGVRCWRSHCGREVFCYDCDLRDIEIPPGDGEAASEESASPS